MRELDECKAEVFRRSENRRKERKKRRNRVIAWCIPLCLLVALWSVASPPATNGGNYDGAIEITSGSTGGCKEETTNTPGSSGNHYGFVDNGTGSSGGSSVGTTNAPGNTPFRTEDSFFVIGGTNMKKISIVVIVVVLILGVLVIPFRINTMNDGGSKEYRALTYRIVHWNCLTDEGIYEKTRLYFFGDISKPIDELWAREEPNVEHRFIATVVELNSGTALVEPVEYEWERKSSDRISFGITELLDIGAEVGSVVQVTYRGAIRETYPATVDATGWEITKDLRHKEYTGQWLDKTTAEEYDYNIFNHIVITEAFSNCFFARTVMPMPYQIKLNGSLSDEWCVGDQIKITYKNAYYDRENGRVEADLLAVEASDFEIDPNACYKPVIYLYPEEETEVSVRLTLDGKLTCTYPAYGNGWTVTAQPDGTLTDAQGQTYNYLYWEGESNAQYDLSKGFCVKGEDTAAFLEDALAKLGLTRREANEFIVYWLPLMEQNPYNIISFQTDAYTNAAQLEIDPAPDTLIRVFMAWRAADIKVELPEQELTAPQRTGFTVVEWGGTEIA